MKSFHFHLIKFIAVFISFWSVAAAADIDIDGEMICTVEKIITVEGSETDWKIYNGYEGGRSEGDQISFSYAYRKYDGSFESLSFGFEGAITNDEFSVGDFIDLEEEAVRVSVVSHTNMSLQNYDQKNKWITIFKDVEDPTKVKKFLFNKNQMSFTERSLGFTEKGLSINLKREKNQINRDGRWMGIISKIENAVSAIGRNNDRLISHQLFLRCSHKTKDVWDELIDAIAANHS